MGTCKYQMPPVPPAGYPTPQVVEEHVSTATTAVVKVPQRAVKKAAQGLAKNTKKLFKVAGKRCGKEVV